MTFVWSLIGFLFGALAFSDIYSSLSFAGFFFILYRLFNKSSDVIVFREFAIFLYILNYLISPIISYSLPTELIVYEMKLPKDSYLFIAFWGILFLIIGIYSLKTEVFNFKLGKIKRVTNLNSAFLKKITIVAVLATFIYKSLPEQFAFIAYLFTLLKYTSSFSLFLSDRRLWYYPVGVLSIGLLGSFLSGMFHDSVIWIIFFGIILVYQVRINFFVKLFSVVFFFIFILFVQSIKEEYRRLTWTGEQVASIELVSSVGIRNFENDRVANDDNIYSALNRANQAWILASTVDNVNRNFDFQGFEHVAIYLEAVFLPRFLAPDKIRSGDKEIFNKYSGHTIGSGTSMGLGVFADGYITYGPIGVCIFGYVLGLLFSIVFKICEYWSRVSPYYALLILPLLSYAIRPDCELQTTLNHLFKGVILYGVFFYLTSRKFSIE